MKLAYINMKFPVDSETFCSRDIEALVKQGHAVDVYSLRFAAKNHRDLISKRHRLEIRYVSLSVVNFLLGIFQIFKSPLLVSKCIYWMLTVEGTNIRHFTKSIILLPSCFYILCYLKRSSYDIVHLFWGHYPSIVGFLYKELFPEKTLTTFIGAHDLVENFPYSAYRFDWTDWSFTHSHANVSSINEKIFVTDRLSVIHRGLNLCEATAPISSSRKSSKKIISVGRLVKGKGFDRAISCLAEIQTLHDFNLHIFGDGPDRARLSELAVKYGVSDRVHFHGFVDSNTVNQHLSNSFLVFAMSTYFAERLPNIVKEAMFLGCVVIAGSSPGIGELINDGEDGFIVGSNVISEVSDILALLEEDAFYDGISLKAIEKISASFNVDKLMGRYVDVWDKLL